MNKYKLTALITACFAIAACGGGGGGGSTEQPASQTSPPTSTQPPVTQPVPKSTKDLVASANFDMQSTWAMTVTIELATQADGFLSLCTDYAPDGDAFDINFGSCILRTNLKDGRFSGKVTLSSAVERLIAVLYYFDENSTPQYQEFAIEPRQSAIVWR